MSDAERIADEELGIEFDIIEIEPLVDSGLDVNPNIGSFQSKGDDDCVVYLVPSRLEYGPSC